MGTWTGPCLQGLRCLPKKCGDAHSYELGTPACMQPMRKAGGAAQARVQHLSPAISQDLVAARVCVSCRPRTRPGMPLSSYWQL